MGILLLCQRTVSVNFESLLSHPNFHFLIFRLCALELLTPRKIVSQGKIYGKTNVLLRHFTESFPP